MLKVGEKRGLQAILLPKYTITSLPVNRRQGVEENGQRRYHQSDARRKVLEAKDSCRPKKGLEGGGGNNRRTNLPRTGKRRPFDAP